LKTGFVEQLFTILQEKGFLIYLTADHGNVEAIGIGRPAEGDIPEARGERVRVYRSDSLLTATALKLLTTLKVSLSGLPTTYVPLFSSGRTSFTISGEQVVVHGGISVEELIVPFVKINCAREK
jgi:hypothetical protein